MAFQGKGFAAVDAFFGDSTNDTAPVSAENQEHAQALLQQPQGKRLGVGAAPGAREETKLGVSASNPLTKRLLQVGTKRKLAQEEAEEDADAEQQAQQDDDDGDDEDEGGRTAIDDKAAASVPVSAAGLVNETTVAVGKKKKKGKKERQREMEEAAQTEESSSKQGKDAEASEPALTEEEPSQPSKKKKRRKIRSRQKNIYKDNRAEKPSHLIQGQDNFRGRPLTPATRQRMNLPDPSENKPWKSSWDGEANQDDGVDSMPLAIDAVDEPVKATKPKKKRSKSTKYKNLR